MIYANQIVFRKQNGITIVLRLIGNYFNIDNHAVIDSYPVKYIYCRQNINCWNLRFDIHVSIATPSHGIFGFGSTQPKDRFSSYGFRAIL